MKNDIKIDDKVMATVTSSSGYYKGTYKGVVVGFTKNNLVKVKSWKGVKCHAIHNVRKYG